MTKNILFVLLCVLVLLGAACFASRVVTVKEEASAAATWSAAKTARTFVIEAVAKSGKTYDFTSRPGRILGGAVRAFLPFEGQAVIPRADVVSAVRRTVDTPEGPREVLEVTTKDHEILSLFPFRELDDRIEGRSRWKTISLPLEDLSSLWVRTTESDSGGVGLDIVLGIGAVLAGLLALALLAW